MKIEYQVCSLEQAKKLLDLNIEQKSLFYWKENEIKSVVTESRMKGWIEKYVPPVGNVFYSAFTVAELGQMLPTLDIKFHKSNNGKGQDFYWASSNYNKIKSIDSIGAGENGKTEAKLRAEVLIYLLENGIITAEEVNQRTKQ